MRPLDLPGDLRIIHEPTRLRIVGLLYRETDLGFTTLRDTLGLTAGNLATHAARLETAGIVQGRDALSRNGFEKRYQITPAGLDLFEAYLATLEAFVADARALAVDEPPARRETPKAEATNGGTRHRPGGKAALGFLAVGGVFVAGEAAQLFLAGASGSDYLGIGLAGGLVATLAGLQQAMARMLGRS